MPEVWFRAKTYGWGWTPATWQGWAVMGMWAAAFVAWLVYRLNDRTPTVGWHFDVVTFAGGVGLAAVLLVVCWTKGERPRWRWGR